MSVILSRHLERTKELLNSYDRQRPFPGYLSTFFRQHPEMGSKDRKVIKDLAYACLRLGGAILNEQTEIRIAAGLFLSSFNSTSLSDFILSEYFPELKDKVSLTFDEKVKLLKNVCISFKEEDIFPSKDCLSNEIDFKDWLRSFFTPPLIFVRIRSSRVREVLSEFDKKRIVYSSTDLEGCYAVSGLKNVDNLESYKRGYFELQDKMSQRTGTYMQPVAGQCWWDACAASGGKSLLLMDLADGLRIDASDLRPSILVNYSQRMDKAGWKGRYSTHIMDLSVQNSSLKKYDGIVADVPCSGSGTWSRNPEGLLRYTLNDIEEFSILQRKIVANLLPSLKPEATLLYITCSVFGIENEINVETISSMTGLNVKQKNYLRGYKENADTLFVCQMKFS